MHADLKGALEQLNKSYKAFEHKGKSLTKLQVKKVLEYGLSKGYKTTAELTDDDVDLALHPCKCGGMLKYVEREGYVCQKCGWTHLFLNAI